MCSVVLNVSFRVKISQSLLCVICLDLRSYVYLNMLNPNLLTSCSRLLVASDEILSEGLTHRVISDKVHRLFVALSYFRPDRFVQILSLVSKLFLLLSLLVSTDLMYIGIFEARYQKLFWRRATVCDFKLFLFWLKL